MTAKEELRMLVDNLSEADAEAWLARMGARPRNGAAAEPIWAAFGRIMADVPDAEAQRIPPSDEVDRVLYGSPPGR